MRQQLAQMSRRRRQERRQRHQHRQAAALDGFIEGIGVRFVAGRRRGAEYGLVDPASVFQRPQAVPLGIEQQHRLDIGTFEQLDGSSRRGALELLRLDFGAMRDLIAHGPHFDVIAQPRQQPPITPPASAQTNHSQTQPHARSRNTTKGDKVRISASSRLGTYYHRCGW
jgi:hypothetical protein